MGFVVATSLGILVGYLLATVPFLGAVFSPMVRGYGSIPHIVFLPILLGIFGVGHSAKITMAVLVAVFPIIVNVSAGVATVPAPLIKLGHSLDLGHVAMAWRITLRAAVPSIIVGMRLGFGAAFLAVVISEFFGSPEGLGVEMSQAYGASAYDQLLAVVSVVALISLIGNWLFLIAQRRLA
ncbi:ABC transporter permease [Nocardioides insulae]|uniref:ABC transporter permease n=1 Tax=Nocardioides insulae TaxID=394734 RepID=UPI000426914A|nr:ABC transporter permease subunit [Nocardioides insulae]